MGIDVGPAPGGRPLTYDEWIKHYVAKRKGHVRGCCVGACNDMKAAYPELTIVKGWANNTEHVWLTAPDGAIVDPTASQFDDGGFTAFFDLARHLARPEGNGIEYRPFKPGDVVRVGKCMNCGEGIYAAVDSLDDPKYARSVCDAQCGEEMRAYLEGETKR